MNTLSIFSDIQSSFDSKVVDKPLAVRSSSLLEDSHYQPFAGVYATYMIQNRPDRRAETLRMLCDAVKSVYASVFYGDSKAYMTATSNVIDQEKMAVIIQEVVGVRLILSSVEIEIKVLVSLFSFSESSEHISFAALRIT